jgi:hypothetical protein
MAFSREMRRRGGGEEDTMLISEFFNSSNANSVISFELK